VVLAVAAAVWFVRLRRYGGQAAQIQLDAIRTTRQEHAQQELQVRMTAQNILFRNLRVGKVGPGRGAGVAAGPFPGASFRIRRMRLRILGSPRVLPVGQLPVVVALRRGTRGARQAEVVAVSCVYVV
jgi:hypothetical protein